ncbi:MAG: glycosyltransferase family 2 protein [Methanobacterium sp.]|uniref:glycosyltransferase family 2 protein n=1 Tax=Methanobacterium sp. TaxID=2164 RepID=UPI003D661538|nr:glycosyltransferase family 2 protein [Methanobacterium sp.]
MYPEVSIIILNWNGWKDTIECLESLYQINYPNYTVIIADNASEDDSINKIKKYCKGKIKTESKFFKFNIENKPIKIVEFSEKETKKSSPPKKEFLNMPSNKKLILIKNDKNYGFAEGNNIPMRYALKALKTEYILLLNNDTVVKPEFLNELIDVGECNEKVGILGPKLLNAYDTNIIDSAGHVIKWGRIVDRGHGEVDNGQYDHDNKVIGAMAAASLYKSKMLVNIGLFDKSYITLYEDAELSWRANKKGWNARSVPNSIVYHKRGQSIRKKDIITEMMVLSTKNTVKTVLLYGSSFQRFLFTFTLLKECFDIIKNKIKNKSDVKIFSYIMLIIKYYFKVILSLFKRNNN